MKKQKSSRIWDRIEKELIVREQCRKTEDLKSKPQTDRCAIVKQYQKSLIQSHS